jgi:hypothetical protein
MKSLHSSISNSLFCSGEQNLLLLEKSKFCTPEQNREFEIEL